MLGRLTRKKVCQPLAPRARAASSSSCPCACSSGISSRATKGKVTKIVARTIPGTAKMICRSCRASHGPSTSLQAEKQHVDQAGHDRRDRKRQIDQRDQQTLAEELELADGPGCGHPKHQIQGNGNGRGQQGQADRRQRIGLASGSPNRPPIPLAKAWEKTMASGRKMNSPRKSTATPIRTQRTRADSPVAAVATRLAGVEVFRVLRGM